MKLAEALQERADIQKRLAQLRQRLNDNARVQEGEDPVEDPEELLVELDKLSSHLEELITRINLTNAREENGETMTALLARRDCLRTKIGIIRDFLDEAGNLTQRSYRTEIRIRSSVSVRDKRKDLDAMSAELRKLDTKIQQKNWLLDLM